MPNKLTLVLKSLTAFLLLLTTSFSLMAQGGVSSFEFVENKGQWDNRIKFKGELSAGDFYLHNNGFTIVQHNADELMKLMRHLHAHDQQTGSSSKKAQPPVNAPGTGNGGAAQIVHSHAYRVQFLSGNESANITPDKVISTYNNYFLGNDPSKWVKHAKIFQAITYKNVYPNIDVRYYSENGALKYDMIVHPGGDINQVALKYEGVNKLQVKNNELVIKTSVGDVKELYPYSYVFDAKSGKKEVKCSYVLDKDYTVRFRVENYDRNATLVVDPTLIFSSFTRSTANNWGFTATYGPNGELYAGGIVFGQGFPANVGAYETDFTGGGAKGVDIGIMKFNANGSQRLYATYLGGTADDLPHSLVSDGAGNLVMLGRTYSGNFPVTVPRVGGDPGGCDIVVTKLTSDGSALIGSMIIGGGENDGLNIEDQFESGNDRAVSLLRNYGDDSHSEVILDGAGNIYVAAQTQSDDFPVRGTVFQPALGGRQDGVVMKINPNCNAITWSSYLGGAEDDAAFVLALQPGTNNIYVAGGTFSTDLLPGPDPSVKEDTLQGQADGFVAVISNDGTSFVRGTYLGTSSMDIIYGIQFDRNGFPYVMGVSRGSWEVTANVIYSNPGSKQFVSKLQVDLSDYVYSTVFGSGSSLPNISPVAFLVDRCENVYISGWGGWIQNGNDPYDLASTVGMPVTPDAIKSTTDGRDFYFIVIKKDATELLYGSFFGQTGGYGEHVDGGTSRFDERGVIYMAICANCYASDPSMPSPGPFPTTPGVWGPVNGMGGNGCNLAAVKIEFNFSGVGSGPRPFIGGVQDTVGCVPFEITFRDTVRNAKRYIWNFGDGSPEVTSTDFEITHTYNQVGTYTIRLIGIDSTTCNIRDTAYTTIYARDDQAVLGFLMEKDDPCEALSYTFTNTSSWPAVKPFGANSFIWDFGDGTRVTTGYGPISHAYALPRSYNGWLILNDTNYCNSPDSIPFTVNVASNVTARIEPAGPGCVPFNIIFDNSSIGGRTYFWDFGDGTTSTDMNPEHEFANVGNYTVKLVVIDSNTCNIIDSTTIPVVVNPVPTANFNATPMPPTENTPTTFYNFSTGGTRYVWLFGDGDSTIRTTMDTVMHQYNATGTFNACLVTYNQFECFDSVCHNVQALIIPRLDVPNAFTPGRNGINSMVHVAGFGIGRMTWRIYNRWGQVVFETNNRKSGWDGTFKGQHQPMDVYAYTLDVEFTDGTKARKTGDITLIR
jgi:gliding motility-associated-like protein